MKLAERSHRLAQELGVLLNRRQWYLVAAESCSGGSLAATCTQVAGSSSWFQYSLVTYTNSAKQRFLSVSPELLESEGAISEACAMAMLEGFPQEADHIRIAITGLAGPGGDGRHPIGTVYMALKSPKRAQYCQWMQFSGDRAQVIQQVVYQGLRELVLLSLFPEEYIQYCYFFALYCDDVDVQQQCYDYAVNAGLQYDDLEPKNNLHMTLKYLGRLTATGLQDQLKLAATLSCKHHGFDLKLSEMKYWKDSDVYVLETKPSGILQNLVHDLGSTEKFVPHISMSKKNNLKRQHMTLSKGNICWSIHHFSLMISFHGLFYIECRRWFLK